MRTKIVIIFTFMLLLVQAEVVGSEATDQSTATSDSVLQSTNVVEPPLDVYTDKDREDDIAAGRLPLDDLRNWFTPEEIAEMQARKAATARESDSVSDGTDVVEPPLDVYTDKDREDDIAAGRLPLDDLRNWFTPEEIAEMQARKVAKDAQAIQNSMYLGSGDTDTLGDLVASDVKPAMLPITGTINQTLLLLLGVFLVGSGGLLILRRGDFSGEQ